MEMPFTGAHHATVERNLTRSESSASCDSLCSALEALDIDIQLAQGDTRALGATTGQRAHESRPPLRLKHHQHCEHIIEKCLEWIAREPHFIHS